MNNRLSSFVQFTIGFFIGVLILLAGATALAYVIFARMAANPPKPIFTEEQPAPAKIAAKPAATTGEKATPEKPKPAASPTTAEALPTGAYKARVTWSSGLSVRSEPSAEASRLAGVDYNTEVVILGQSPDGKWQKIRLSGSQEGWIKAGNVAKIE